ncbi:MAG: xanthine dehydrogenase molybdopterin binding subunit, partial [Betaproteobacteria bacterium]|nr:xanthine dehydrogenase molybdopterin binding subunit [Betaproteobacteria bacterium]
MKKPHDLLARSPAIPNFSRQDNPPWPEAEWPALREGARVGATPPPGRPKAGCPPLGGSDQEAGAWGPSTPPHESAHLHVSGQATYTDDAPELQGTLHAALGLSPFAHGKLLGIDLARLRAQPGVVAVFSAADIPATNDCGPVVHDDPILADGTLRFVGQPVFLVVATTQTLARRAAALAREVIQAEALPAVLTAREAHAQGQ